MSTYESKITIKTFAGIRLTPHIQLQLNNSKLWKSNTVSQQLALPLCIVPHGSHQYLGIYIPQEHLGLPYLQEVEQEILKNLLHLCPKCEEKTPQFEIFPQVFIA